MWELPGHAGLGIRSCLAENSAVSGQGKSDGTYEPPPGTASCPPAGSALVNSFRGRNTLSNAAKVPQAAPCGAEQLSQLVPASGLCSVLDLALRSAWSSSTAQILI